MTENHYHGLTYDDLVEMVEEMRPELNQLRARGRLVVGIEHSLKAARATIDRLKRDRDRVRANHGALKRTRARPMAWIAQADSVDWSAHG